jgi:hypothetical protein
VDVARPEDLVAAVHDEPSFLSFVELLARDFVDAAAVEYEGGAARSRGAPAVRWEHLGVDSYLESAAAFGASTICSADQPGENVWRRCAEILMAGKRFKREIGRAR